jgi:Kef-type K+ transport system membrane component KefB
LIAVTIVAFSAKFIGCAVAARLNGLVWRESFAIGSLMSCKGLVELIVLNIGLQAKILSTRVFTMVGIFPKNMFLEVELKRSLTLISLQ